MCQQAFKGKHKIQDRWENTSYKVLTKVNCGLSIYKVQKGGENHVRILHHNMLLPLIIPEDSTNYDLKPVDPDGTDSEDKDPYVGPMTRNRVKAQDPVLASTNTV